MCFHFHFTNHLNWACRVVVKEVLGGEVLLNEGEEVYERGLMTSLQHTIQYNTDNHTYLIKENVK